MTTTVEVHIEELTDAVSKVDTLATAIGNQRAAAQGASPIHLPTLSDGSRLARTATWLTDQKPFLQGLVDIAVLLDGDGNGQATFDVTTTMEGVEEMIGETLADQSENINPYEGDAYEEYAEVFDRWTTSEQAMSAFYTTMTPEGTLRFMSYMASDVEGMDGAVDQETQQSFLDSMRSGLETATNAPATLFDGEEFGAGLVDEATIDPEDLYGRGEYNPSGALAFLLHDGDFGRPFLDTVATDLDEYERIEMDSGGQDVWGLRPDQGVNFGNFVPHEVAMTYDNLDPMTGLMSAMQNDPEYALEFFSDESHPEGTSHRSHYYLNQRDWDQDGFASITGALDVATTDPDIIGDPESDQAHDAAVLASRTVEYLSEREDPDAMIERMQQTGSDAPENLAHILSTYMHGVDQAISNNQEDDVVPGAGGVYSDAFGATVANVPSFDLPSLETFSLMTMASDDGFAELRNGLNEYRADTLGALADGVANGDGDSALETGIQNDANLEGFFVRQLGDDRIAEGAEADARIQAWVDTGADIVDLLPVPGASRLGEGVASDIYSAVTDRAKGDGKDAILEALANNEGEEVDSSNDLANQTLLQQQYAVASLLDDRDLSANPDGMSEISRPDGSLISWDELNELSLTERNQVISEIYSTDLGVGDNFNRQDYKEAYLSQFEDYFEGARNDD